MMRNKLLPLSALTFFLALGLSLVTSFAMGQTNPTAAQRCAVDLCGPAQNYSKIMASGEFGKLESEQNKKFFAQKISPLIQKNISLAQSLHLATAKSGIFEKLKTEKLTDQQRAFVLTLGLYKILTNKQSQLSVKIFVPTPEGKYVVDKERLAQALPAWTSQRLNSIATLMNAFLATSYFDDAYSWRNGTLDDYIASASEAEMQKSRLFIDANYSYVSEMLGASIHWDVEPGLVDRFVGNEELTVNEKSRLFSGFLLSMYFTAARDNAVVKAAQATDLSVAEVVALLQKNTISVGNESLQSSCAVTVNQNLAAAPSEFRVRKMEELFGYIKKAIRKVATRYVTGAAYEEAMKAIDTLTIAQPLVPWQIRANVIATFTAQGKALESAIALTEKTQDEKWPYFAMSLLYKDAGTDSGYTSNKRACDSLAPVYLIDRAYADTNRINLSWQTAIFSDLGAGVIAHELGHIVSGRAKLASEGIAGFSETRSCTTSIHKTLGADDKTASGYQEEDWADTFAMSVLNELNTQWPYAQNYACVLITTDLNKTYLNVDNWNKSSETEIHSTDLLRAILVQQGMGRALPISCQALVKSATDNKSLPTCAK